MKLCGGFSGGAPSTVLTLHGECKEMEEGCSLSAHFSTCICIKEQFCWISPFCYFPKQDAFSSSSVPPGRSVTLLLSDLCSALMCRGACVCVYTCIYNYLCVYMCVCACPHAGSPSRLVQGSFWDKSHKKRSPTLLVQAALAKKPGRNHTIPGCKEASTPGRDIRANVTDSAVSSDCLLTLGLCWWFMPWHKSPTPGGSPGQQRCCYTGCCSLLALHHFPEWGQEHLLTPSCCLELLALFWWKTPGLATQIYFCNANKVSICK